MADLTELKNTLDGIAVGNGFVLDSRSDESILTAFQNYAALIPFDTDGHSWADFFFMANNSPAALAQLHASSSQADGTLLPQQAFLLAFIDLLKTPRTLLNYFPAAHRELYYRDLLGMSEKDAMPDSVALSFQLKPTTEQLFLPAGKLFDAGQDQRGVALRYALDQSLLVNQGQWSDLRWVQPGTARTQLASAPFNLQNDQVWPEYGMRLFDDSAADQNTVVTGRMVESALLAMPAGLRTITVTFSDDLDASTLTIAQVSSGDSWLDLAVSSTSATVFTFTLPADAAAIASPQDLDGITSSVPLMKIGRNDGGAVPEILSFTTDASGSSEVHYSTDYGVGQLDTDNVSYPFGTSPVVGSGFNLIDPGWCSRTESVTLTLALPWSGLPTVGFPTWYAGYDAASIPADNDQFTVQAMLVSATGKTVLEAKTDYKTSATDLGTSYLSLFKLGTDAPIPTTLTIVLPPLLQPSTIDPSNPCDWPQWLRLELVGRDFGHADYQKLAGTKSLNPPYTPQLNSMTVDYTMSATTSDFNQYLLTPFGYVADTTVPDDPIQSQLYLGLTGGQPGETISLYWQLQSPQTLVPSWEYLNQDNQWSSLSETVVDGTDGMLTSGLWSTVLPDDAADDVSQMPTGRCWLRAIIDPPELPSDNTSRYPWLIGIAANSMTATLNAPDTVDAAHFLRPLPAGTVTRPVAAIAGIQTVTQPWPSSGGEPPEAPTAFFSRVAQRLSHRERALTWQDMASLLKARYSSVFDVAIPPVDVLTRIPASSTQTLLVIPVNSKKDNADPLRPKFSQAHLSEMTDYLDSLGSAWASITLINPTYTNVAIAYDVTFNVNPDYGYHKLQELLTVNYMPWMWDRQSGVTLGNTLDYYGIIAWIQQLPFVVQVNSLTLDGGKASVQGGEQDVLILTWQSPALESSEGAKNE
ncbi:hypothetical protein PQQ51_33140 [Paraburkholderia xenovorans]|uniref:hypothetical protein n=1 Tax=Paraburkholderia xenovorans TaxID=36873 RepID=UPI0038B9BE5C